MGNYMHNMGVQVPLPKTIFGEETKKSLRKAFKPIPITKVSDYYEEENGNTTLLVEFVDQTSIAILGSGAGVAIVIKDVWEPWGNQL